MSDEQQRLDDEARQFALLLALQKVHRAGLKDEAMLFAYECGLGSDWKKRIVDFASGANRLSTT